MIRKHCIFSQALKARALSSLHFYSSVSSVNAPKPKLIGRKCMITGASRGIGRAIATRFADEGADTILIGRNQETLQETIGRLQEREGGGKHVAHVGDVCSPAFWQKTSKEVKDIDILVNAAGLAHSTLLVNTPDDVIERIVDTNLMSTIWACRYVSKGMVRQRNGGCIINVSSLLAMKGGQGSSVYAASKAGVIGLTRSLACEMERFNIRANVLVPGYISTNMTQGMTGEAQEQARNAIPIKRFGTVDEVADAAFFLATNPYANNCVLNVDGGLSAT